MLTAIEVVYVVNMESREMHRGVRVKYGRGPSVLLLAGECHAHEAQHTIELTSHSTGLEDDDGNPIVFSNCGHCCADLAAEAAAPS